MSYSESEIKCDWCNGRLNNGADVACRECYEQLESENYELKQKIEALEQGD